MATKPKAISLLRYEPRTRSKPRLLPKKTPKQPRAKLTFDAIVMAATRLLEELGYQQLTTNGVADVAGVAVGGLYAYFANKEALVAEVVRHTLRELLLEVEGEFGAVALVADRERAVELLVRRCAQLLVKRRALLKVLFEQVPFLMDLPEVRAFPTSLFALAWRYRAIAQPAVAESSVFAKAYLYLLIPIGRWVTYAAVVDRPAWIPEQEAEDALVEIFRRLLR
ncbi:MAG TPA: TetR/AcrR family transcriptional regulator [Polyangiales bacterium]